MIWLTWRLHRTETLLGTALLTIIGLFLTITGLRMTSAYREMGIACCFTETQADTVFTCLPLSSAFFNRFGQLDSMVAWLNFLPVVLAMLLATPLLNEFEHGSFRMTWTQSITRARWVAYRIGAVMVMALLLGLLWRTVMTWWMGPFSAQRGRMEADYFSFQGTVPIAYMLVSVALVLAAGAILRRTIPALAAALVVYLPLRLGIEFKLRPHYREPLTAIELADGVRAGSTTGVGLHDWVVTSGWVDQLGNRLTETDILRLCPPDGGAPNPAGLDACIRARGLLRYEEYQPADRFWQFQLIETAIYLSLAAGLIALTVWWITRKLA